MCRSPVLDAGQPKVALFADLVVASGTALEGFTPNPVHGPSVHTRVGRLGDPVARVYFVPHPCH